eukprot:3715677-Rhodomonas_salina.1
MVCGRVPLAAMCAAEHPCSPPCTPHHFTPNTHPEHSPLEMGERGAPAVCVVPAGLDPAERAREREREREIEYIAVSSHQRAQSQPARLVRS